MTDAWIGGKKHHLDPGDAIGKGGEADVYKLPDGSALKIFKAPTHPDLVGDLVAQAAAKRRLSEHQDKLRAFPRGLPSKVVTPDELATDSNGLVIGYKMKLLTGAEVLLKYTQRSFRGGMPNSAVVDILKDLHGTIVKVHGAGVVVGDFNDLNVLVTGTEGHLIDSDSMQFGRWLCSVFTTRFVDPLLCDPGKKSLELVKPHNAESDWYAFAVMVHQLMLFVEPYGGTFKPKDPSGMIPHTARPLKRITVYHPDVRYPKPAIPYGMLSDDVLQFFHDTFEKDKRGEFPAGLLARMQWTKCTSCGMEHARQKCPGCTTAAPEAVKMRVTVTSKVEATRVFYTRGTILRAEAVGGKVMWLYHEGASFMREGGVKVADGAIDHHIRYRLRADSTFMAKGGTMVRLTGGTPKDRTDVDVLNNLPVYDTNDSNVYWCQNGTLYKDGLFGQERIGDVLAGQTMVWVGPSFGFGLYRAGQMTVSFVFGPAERSLNDSVKIHPIRGKLIDAVCVLSKERAWFMTSSQEGGKTVNRCSVIMPDGAVEASFEAEAGDGSWLSSIRGMCASGKGVLVPTDQGVLQVKATGGTISVAKEFPETEQFVDSDSKLLLGNDGLYVVSAKEITRLVLK